MFVLSSAWLVVLNVAIATQGSCAAMEPPSSSTLLDRFEVDLRNPMTAQRETLKEILSNHKSVPSLRNLDITAETSLEEFRERHPITTYDDYEPLVNAVADGEADPSDIVGEDDELLSFAGTSGTSRGRLKLIPWTKADFAARMGIFALNDLVSRREGVPSPFAGKRLTTTQMGRITVTKSGLLAGAASTLGFADPSKRAVFQKSMATPVDICILDSPHGVAVYAHLLAGLVRREDVTCLSNNYANEVLEMLLSLVQNRDVIIDHLRHGVKGTVDGLVDDKSLAVLGPLLGGGAPDLADLVERECNAGWGGIVPRLFPNCAHVFTITTGTMIPYAERLRKFTGDGIPILSTIYGATESFVGINTDPLQKESDLPLYTLLPRGSVLEFLPYPEEEDGRAGWPVTLDEVEVGKTYEVIVTSRNCMFRYRLGDVVRVAKFEEKTPVVEFLHRSSAVLSLRDELTTEHQLMAAMAQAQRECGFAVSEYVFDGDRDCTPARYVVYCEVPTGSSVSADEMSVFASSIDAGLCAKNSAYNRSREIITLGGVKMVVVEPGTFLRHREGMFARGTDPGQFKSPRCVNNADFRDMLCRASIAEYTQ